jgi:hypothetical protein
MATTTMSNATMGNATMCNATMGNATMCNATMLNNNLIAETSFIAKQLDPILRVLKSEAIDRIDSVVDELPKYKTHLTALINNFTIEDMLYLMNTIFRDNDFKASAYYKVYNKYFDEIEDLIHTMYKKWEKNIV